MAVPFNSGFYDIFKYFTLLPVLFLAFRFDSFFFCFNFNIYVDSIRFLSPVNPILSSERPQKNLPSQGDILEMDEIDPDFAE